jgi:hypothetical protein
VTSRNVLPQTKSKIRIRRIIYQYHPIMTGSIKETLAF